MKFRGSKLASMLNGRSSAVRRNAWRTNEPAVYHTESLEDRVLLAAAVDDPYEDNDIKSQAYNLGTLTTPLGISGLQLRDAADWYSFTMQGSGSAGDYVKIDFQHGLGNLSLEIYDSRGLLVDRSTGSTDTERVSLNGLDPGTYFIKVLGVGGAQNAYSMIIDPASLPPDDQLENNDTFGTAANLGVVTSPLIYRELKMADAADYYRFRIDSAGAAHSYAKIEFSHALGDLDLDLYTSAGTLVRRSVGQFDVEQVSLRGLAAGEYVLKVSGYQGAFNPDYTLSIAPQQTAAPTSGNRVLYANFDGIFLSNAQLREWAGDDWASSVFSYLDPQGDGIRVNPYERFHPGREQIIAGVLANLAIDLAPFGITVRRVTTAEVMAGVTAGQGATTLFFGVTNEPGIYHVAGDIDYANNNRTDIAFVGDEADGWGNIADAITAASDVALHEAGHTFGLYHVNVAQFGFPSPESMGLRYSVDQSQWLVDTSFLDSGFAEYIDHGGRLAGFQNTYQAMLSHFGLSANATKRFDFAPNIAQQHIVEDMWTIVPEHLRPESESGGHDHDRGDGESLIADRLSKLGVARPNAGGGLTFVLDSNGDGEFDSSDAVFDFGLAGDIVVIGDWNGDGVDDFGVARPNRSGGLTFSLDSNGNRQFDGLDGVFDFGLVGDQIVVGDWNGDGIDDLGVARPNGFGGLIFSLDGNGNRFFDQHDSVFNFGLVGDAIVVGDWDGDRIDQLGIARSNRTGGLTFSLDSNGDRAFNAGLDAAFNFGLSEDRVIVGDWDGDGSDALGVARANRAGALAVLRDMNEDNQFDATDALFALEYGLPDDLLVVGNWRTA